ncbi:MAG: hypothetical protein CSA62_02515 [Planctomycetota bacterium]|nr:MAG: hypothetical protein CSA62_02515 [Planctomycetota bacterium]
MKRKNLRYLLLPLPLLAGCVFADPAPEPELDLEIPASWGSSSPDGDVRGRWWFSFEDPQLNDLIRNALADNRALHARAEGVRAALSAAEIAGADRAPQSSAGVNGLRQKQVLIGLPIPGASRPITTRSTSYGASLDISWELDLWGKLVARAGAGQAEFEASLLEYHASALSLIAQVAKSWFALREGQAQLQLAQRSLSTWEKGLEIVRDRYQRGLVPALDLSLTESLLHSAQAALQLRERQCDASRRSLQLLVGHYPNAKLEGEASLPALPTAPPAGLPMEILDRRPDLRAARTQLLALRYHASEAEASLYPNLSLTASVGTRSDALKDLIDGNFSVWSILGRIVQPIYQGGRLRAHLALREARVRESAERFADLVLRACAEVEHSLAAEEHFRKEIEAHGKALAAARSGQELALDRYCNGRLDVLTLLDAQRKAFTAESLLLQTQRLALQNRIDLHLALGGDLAATSPVPPEEATSR